MGSITSELCEVDRWLKLSDAQLLGGSVFCLADGTTALTFTAVLSPSPPLLHQGILTFLLDGASSLLPSRMAPANVFHGIHVHLSHSLAERPPKILHCLQDLHELSSDCLPGCVCRGAPLSKEPMSVSETPRTRRVCVAPWICKFTMWLLGGHLTPETICFLIFLTEFMR